MLRYGKLFSSLISKVIYICLSLHMRNDSENMSTVKINPVLFKPILYFHNHFSNWENNIENMLYFHFF